MSAVAAVLVFAAWVGHAAIWLVALNIVYSQPLPRWALKTLRAGVGLLVWSFPLVAAVAYGSPLNGAVWAYLGACWAMTFVVIPLVTVRRHQRRLPAGIVTERSRLIDAAARLGRKPVGDGKHHWLARLPGNQVFQAELTTLELRLPDLPAAWDGLTILHLTDLHFHGTPERDYFRLVFDECAADGPIDLLALTGDFVDTGHHHRWIVPLVGRLRPRDGAFAVLGNHDLYYDAPRVRQRLRRLGVRVLGNGWELATVRGEPMLVIGNECPWFRPAPDLTNCPNGPFRLCLSHTPDNIAWARRHRVDLMLSGHVHGGAIRLPVFGSLFVPSRYSRRYDCGVFREPPTWLCVSRGLSGREPLRYNCRPQATRIVLKK
jgi:uncharacterized protein